MVSWRQGLEHGQARCHSRAEGNRFHSAFQVGEALLKGTPVGVVDPAIEKMPREFTIRIALKGCGSVEGHGDRARCRVDMPPGVNAESLKFLVRIWRQSHSPEFSAA